MDKFILQTRFKAIIGFWAIYAISKQKVNEQTLQ